MARARHLPQGCEDLQVEVMQAVDLALNDAGTRLCLRHGEITGADARWFLAECAIVSLFASIARSDPGADLFLLAATLVRQANQALAKGSAVPLDQAVEVKG